MRWAFGTNRQIGWAVAVVLLRMVVFGAVLLGVLRPLSVPKIVEDASLAVLAIVFAYVFLVRVPRGSWRELGFSVERFGPNVLFGVVVFALGLIVVGVRLWIADMSLTEALAQVRGYSLLDRTSMILTGIHVVFGEELIFRGYLQPGLRARLSPALAIGITSFVFALYHVQLEPHAFIGNFVWGVVWGVARERSGSTVPSSVAHFLNWSVLGWL
jgi:membrane protease YdiL (CAAX protease family)